MTSIFDVPAHTAIEEIAKDLKVNKKVEMPEFALFVKTGCNRERAPQNEDWWYIRMASILRRVYISKKVTVNSLRSYYGGKKRRGVKPPKFKRAGGKIIRVCLQELGKLGFVKLSENKGRIITPEGQKYLDKMASEIYKKLNLKNEKTNKKKATKEATKEVIKEATKEEKDNKKEVVDKIENKQEIKSQSTVN